MDNKNIYIEKNLKKISSQWFLTNPVKFSVLCTHKIIENKNISVPMRCGKFLIEYNPEITGEYSYEKLQDCLTIEVYRILLQHPYSRLPHNVQYGILGIASDITIYSLLKSINEDKEIKSDYLENLPGVLYLKNQAVRFGTLTHPLGIKWIGSEELKFFQKNLVIDHKTGALNIIDKLTFEQWYKKIYFLVKETSIAGENAGSYELSLEKMPGDLAELWEENEEAQNQINEQIEKAESENGWGGIGGLLEREIKDSCDFSFDYRRALAKFRQNIVSANRTLTRMRPSRRYGFKAMGSRYERKANILIAVDVSGSITDSSFEHFTHAIKNFFFLGIIEKIDLLFFDVNLKNTKPISFRKKVELDKIKGRGGTNFQPAIDYFSEHNSEYSGLIIFTDGEGDSPQIKCSSKNILWILDSRLAYEKSYQWITKGIGCQATYLPF